MVHETAHSLDISEKRDRTLTRELLGEATSIGFELAFADYLLQQNRFSRDGINNIINSRMKSSFNDAKTVLGVLVLCKEKEENGKVTNEFLWSIPNEYHYNIHNLIRDLNSLLRKKPSLTYRNRYAFGGLIASTFAKVIRQDGGIEKIRLYLEACKKDDFEGAINALGITNNREGLVKLIRNMREIVRNANKDENERE